MELWLLNSFPNFLLLSIMQLQVPAHSFIPSSQPNFFPCGIFLSLSHSINSLSYTYVMYIIIRFTMFITSWLHTAHTYNPVVLVPVGHLLISCTACIFLWSLVGSLVLDLLHSRPKDIPLISTTQKPQNHPDLTHLTYLLERFSKSPLT